MGDKRKRGPDDAAAAIDGGDVKKAKKSSYKEEKNARKARAALRAKEQEQNGAAVSENDKSKGKDKHKKKKKDAKKSDGDATTTVGEEVKQNGGDGAGEGGKQDKQIVKQSKRERDRMEKKERKEKKKQKREESLLVRHERQRQQRKAYNEKKEDTETPDIHDEDEEPEQIISVVDKDNDVEVANNEETNGTVNGDKSRDNSSSHRFICFIGNLPFSATLESVTAHFSKIKPTSVRVPIERDAKKGRGFAFLEFDSYDRMKSCLKLYHHSSFDDGKTPARRINVELTAGGGGSKSETRKTRIAEKNKKLGEERARAAKEGVKRKRIEEKKERAGANVDAKDGSSAVGAYGDIHPSRMAQIRR